jgi:ethanolamine ammonia-lyase small subunit
MNIDRHTLEALVREVVTATLRGDSSSSPSPSASSSSSSSSAETTDERCDTHCTPPKKASSHRDVVEVERVVAASPSRLAQGRVGTRYTTRAYIELRAEHAIALDAVHSRVADDFAARHGLVPLQTRVKDHAEYLLYPDHGRRLDDESKARLLAQGTQGADVVVIVGDGLSAVAAERQAPTLLPALTAALKAQGFVVGTPLFVRYARIGVQDEIGVLLKAKSTIVLVGERPGLGTGDSLSIYTAYNPRLNQDNAEKNCISNVRDLGFPPAEAAVECARLMRRTFDAGGGGVHLVRPTRDVSRRVAM